MWTKRKKALLRTTFVGFGDLLFMTPVIRYLNKVHEEVHVWCNNPDGVHKY